MHSAFSSDIISCGYICKCVQQYTSAKFCEIRHTWRVPTLYFNSNRQRDVKHNDKFTIYW